MHETAGPSKRGLETIEWMEQEYRSQAGTAQVFQAYSFRRL
jgi:hypothetical protein